MLRNRDFFLLWLVNVSTTLALELFTVTILVTVFEQTASTVQAAGTMVARMLPAFLLGPVAGALVDRFPRKYVLLGMDVLRLSLVLLSLLLLRGDGALPVAAIYLILAGLSAAGVFHRPARLALIPSLVAPGELVRANSLILVTNQVVMAVSYSVGGWLILVFPLRYIALGVVALFLVAILAVGMLVVPSRSAAAATTGRRETLWQSVVSGWAYLRRHPVARPLTIMEMAEHVPHGIWTGALMLAFTTHVLGGGAPEWGYQTTAYFSGMTLGSLLALGMDRWLRRFPGRIIVINAALTGFFTLAYASSPHVAMAVFWAFIFGPPFAIRDVAQDSLLQATVSDGQLGRVYATREMLRSVVFMCAGLFFAWLSDYVPIRQIYYLGGTMYLLTGVYALSNRALRASKVVGINN